MSPASEKQGRYLKQLYEVLFQPETLGIGFAKGLDRAPCFTTGIVYTPRCPTYTAGEAEWQMSPYFVILIQ